MRKVEKSLELAGAPSGTSWNIVEASRISLVSLNIPELEEFFGRFQNLDGSRIW